MVTSLVMTNNTLRQSQKRLQGASNPPLHPYTIEVNNTPLSMSDAYLDEVQVEEMYDDYAPTDEDWESNPFLDVDAELEAFSLQCAFGPEEY